MNKTVNINLANIFFHIDEDAFDRLQNYLAAIRRSFEGTEGGEEILADIESRMAELFTETMQHDRQVITKAEVDRVIAVMGQPEDYQIDEEFFADEPQSTVSPETRTKKLYRDTEHKYIGGVCAGLEHYLGIDALWIRLIFILTAVFSGFGFVAYILLWILVPEAVTTAQKIAMTGEPVTISNIEKKIREGLDTVGDKVKNADFDKMGQQVKKGSKGFFDTIGAIIVFFLKVVAKFIGIMLILVGAVALISLFVSLFTLGSFGFADGLPFREIASVFTDTPLWLIALLIFFTVGIPFFVLFYLGLKIAVSNLKPLGTIASFALLGLWLIAIAGVISVGVRTAALRNAKGTVSTTQTLRSNPSDTLQLKVRSSNFDTSYYFGNERFELIEADGVRKIYLEEVSMQIKPTDAASVFLEIEKSALGRSEEEGRKWADKIEVPIEVNERELQVGSYLTVDASNQFREQEASLTLFVPNGQVLQILGDTDHFLKRSLNDKDYPGYAMSGHLWQMGEDGTLRCLDCE